MLFYCLVGDNVNLLRWTRYALYYVLLVSYLVLCEHFPRELKIFVNYSSLADCLPVDRLSFNANLVYAQLITAQSRSVFIFSNCEYKDVSSVLGCL